MSAPTTSRAYYRYGWTLTEQNDYRRATQSLNLSIAYDREHTQAYLERAFVHRRLGQFHAALADCTEVLGMVPRHADAYACRGHAYCGLGNPQQAMDDWATAIAMNPELSPGLAKWIGAVKDGSQPCPPVPRPGTKENARAEANDRQRQPD